MEQRLLLANWFGETKGSSALVQGQLGPPAPVLLPVISGVGLFDSLTRLLCKPERDYSVNRKGTSYPKTVPIPKTNETDTAALSCHSRH